MLPFTTMVLTTFVRPIALYAASTRSCGAAETVSTPAPRPIVAAESSRAASVRCLYIEILLLLLRRGPERFDPLYNNMRHFSESWHARRGETATPFPCNWPHDR